MIIIIEDGFKNISCRVSNKLIALYTKKYDKM